MLYFVMGVEFFCLITFLAYGKLLLNKLINPADKPGSTYL